MTNPSSAAVRSWCEDAGIRGTDLDTALTSWAKHPMGVDGIRVQRVIEARHEHRTLAQVAEGQTLRTALESGARSV